MTNSIPEEDVKNSNNSETSDISQVDDSSEKSEYNKRKNREFLQRLELLSQRKTSRKKPRTSAFQQKQTMRDGNEKYFEATLQLRGITPEEGREILAQVAAANIRITQVVKHSNGFDLFITSQKFIQKLERWIKNRFVCETKMTSTLHTRDNMTSKDLYRLTLLVTMVRHRIGDIIQYQDEEVKIVSMGRRPVGKILKTGKRIFLDSRLLATLHEEEKAKK